MNIRLGRTLQTLPIRPPAPTGPLPSVVITESLVPISVSNHSISRVVTASYTFLRRRITFRSPVAIQSALETLPSAIAPAARATSSITAIPTSWRSADLSLRCCVGEGESSKGVKDLTNDVCHERRDTASHDGRSGGREKEREYIPSRDEWEQKMERGLRTMGW